jgi:hypothetical protein
LDRLYAFQDIAIELDNRVEPILAIPEEKQEEINNLLIEHVNKIKGIRENYPPFHQIAISKKERQNEK